MSGVINIKTKQGDLVPNEINCRYVSYLGKPCFLAVARDVTETKLLQNQLLRSERLAATGQLAASIAHEINSPLQGITALLMHMLAEDGLINVMDPVAFYAPEFARKGKENITIHQILAHRGGIPGLPTDTPLDTLWDEDATWMPGLRSGWRWP